MRRFDAYSSCRSNWCSRSRCGQLAIFIGCLVVVIASIILPIAFVIVVSGAVIGYIVSRGTWIVVTKYVLPSEVPLIDLH